MNESEPETGDVQTDGHQAFYSHAQLYEIAFSYRDFQQECDFLTDCFVAASARKPESVLELAAGPANHAREFASRGLVASALDLSEEMAKYATAQAEQEGAELHYVVGDMASFQTENTVDLVTCLICSLGYLLTNERIETHLQTVARALGPDGVYILELEHPKAVFVENTCTENEWEVEAPSGIVRIQWGPDAPMDPLTLQTAVKARIEHRVEDQVVASVEQRSLMRSFTRDEIVRFVKTSQCFEIVDVFGAFSRDCAVDDEKAWRMIFVLKKTASLA